MMCHVVLNQLTDRTDRDKRKQSHNQLARRCKKQERLSSDSLLSPDYTLLSVLYNVSVYRQWHHQLLLKCKMRTFTLVDVDIWDSPYQWRQTRTNTDWWLTDWLTDYDWLSPHTGVLLTVLPPYLLSPSPTCPKVYSLPTHVLGLKWTWTRQVQPSWKN